MGIVISYFIIRRYSNGRSLNPVHKHKILDLKGIYAPNEGSAISIITSPPVRVSHFYKKNLRPQTYSGIIIHSVVEEMLITNSVTQSNTKVSTVTRPRHSLSG
jgi:hypothetical protein